MNGGNYVSELEFVKELISLLNKGDKRSIIKQAATRGFEVHGFSNKPYNAPQNIINSSLIRRNKKNISNYFLILDVIDKFPIEQAEDKTLIQLAKDWISDVKARSSIEEKLGLCRPDMDNGQAADSNRLYSINDSGTEEGHNEPGIEDGLEEKNTMLQKKNKELKEKLKSSRIEMDNLRKDFNICMKEEKKQLAEIQRLQLLVQEYSASQKKLEEQLLENKNYSAGLLSQVEALNHYKDKALKIACFVKNCHNLQFEGYNITFFDEWSEQVKDNINFNDYSEVWYVHEGFNYNCFMEIKKYFKCKTREYMTLKKLMNGV